MSNIVINSVTNEVSSFLVNFTATGTYNSVVCYVDNVTDDDVDQIEFSVTNNLTTGLFNVTYTSLNIVDNELYAIRIKGYYWKGPYKPQTAM